MQKLVPCETQTVQSHHQTQVRRPAVRVTYSAVPTAFEQAASPAALCRDQLRKLTDPDPQAFVAAGFETFVLSSMMQNSLH